MLEFSTNSSVNTPHDWK